VSNSYSNPAWLRWGRRLLFLGVAGAAVFAALTLFLSRFLDPEELAARLEPRLEAALAREVEVGRVEVSLFPLGVRLRDVSVADPTGLAPFLAQVESLEFRAKILPLFRRELRIGRLVLENPVADLRVSSDGRSNFGDFSTQPPQDPSGGDESLGGGSFGLELNGIRISGGSIRFESQEDSTAFDVEALQVRASVRREASGPWFFMGGSEATLSIMDGASSPDLTGLPLAFDFDIETGPAFEKLEIRSGSLGMDPVSLAVVGTVEDLKEPTRAVSLSLTGERMPLGAMVAVLSDHFGFEVPGEVGGVVDAELRVEGEMGPGVTPELSGTVTLASGGLEAPDGTQAAQDLSAELVLATDHLLQFQLHGEVLDGPFSLEGRGEVGGRGALNFQLRANPDLGLIESVVELPEGVTAIGRLDTQVRVNGSTNDLRSLRFWGDFSPASVFLTHPALGVTLALPRGRVSLEGGGVSFQNFPVSLGEDQLVVTAELQSVMSYGLPGRTVLVRGTVRGPRLDLPKISTAVPPDSALTYGKVVFARVGGRLVEGRSPEDAARELRLARPDSLPVAGALRVALDTLIYARGRVEDLRALVEFGPSFVRVTEATLKRFGGDIRTSMNLALGEEAREPFNMTLHVQDLDASEFLGANSPLGEVVRGRLSMNMDLIGFLDELLLPDGSSLVGSGSFALTEGGMTSVPLTQSFSSFLGLEGLREPAIQDWSSSFFLGEGLIRLAEATLTGAPGDPRVGGAIGLDGGLDLISIFALHSDRLGSHARENLGITDALAGRIPNRPGFVQAIVHIGGTVYAPELYADPAATIENVAEDVRAQAEAEAERRIQEQRTRLQDRATGLLGNLLRPRDPVAGPGQDSIPGDSLRPDTVPTDMLLPDTLGGDTIPPDTLIPEPLIPDTVRGDSVRPDTVPPDTVRHPEGPRSVPVGLFPGWRGAVEGFGHDIPRSP